MLTKGFYDIACDVKHMMVMLYIRSFHPSWTCTTIASALISTLSYTLIDDVDHVPDHRG